MILAVDFGSTFTKVTAVCAENAEVVGTAKAFTTIGTDVREGLENALAELYAQIGHRDFTIKLAASSAGGGLKMVAVGLVAGLTAKAATLAACSAGAKVVKTYAFELSPAEQNEIAEIAPNLILLSGGTDGGNKDVILHNAEILAGIDGDFSVIVAGNKCVAEQAAGVLRAAGKHAVVTNNVMPVFDKLDILPAKEAILELFLAKIVRAKGLCEVAEMMTAEIVPTPLAVFDAVQLLAKECGTVLAVDVGGATTDVCSVCDGKPSQGDVVLKGLPEPFAKRSVEGDLGLRYSLDGLVEAAAIRSAFSQGDEYLSALAEYRAICERNPSFIPARGSLFGEYDEHFCALAVEMAVERHAGTWDRQYTAFGETRVQVGKDLTHVDYVVGVGGAVVHSRNPQEMLANAVFDPKNGMSLKPKNPKFLWDKRGVFAALGLITRLDAGLALKMMGKEIG